MIITEAMSEKILPKFVRTKHLPLEPNAQRDDLIATPFEASVVFQDNGYSVTVEEKVDGANVGMTVYNGEPLIRNRSHILNKAYGRKKTPAKLQFTPIWTWFYGMMDSFYELESLLGFMPSIYGEWMVARHSVSYDLLPSYFIAYDAFNPEEGVFLRPEEYRPALEAVGFNLTPTLALGVSNVTDAQLKAWRDEPSPFSSTDNREGLYIKVSNEHAITHRFKMVRPGFVQGENWNDVELVKNKVRRG